MRYGYFYAGTNDRAEVYMVHVPQVGDANRALRTQLNRAKRWMALASASGWVEPLPDAALEPNRTVSTGISVAAPELRGLVPRFLVGGRKDTRVEVEAWRARYAGAQPAFQPPSRGMPRRSRGRDCECRVRTRARCVLGGPRGHCDANPGISWWCAPCWAVEE